MSIPLAEFFNEVKVPDFLKQQFEKEDWYMILAALVDLVDANITSTPFDNPKVSISGKVQIGKNVTIGHFTVIEGPVYIGDNVEIGPGVFLRAGSVIGNDCVVGHAGEVKNAIMMDGSKASNHTFIGDSIIGPKGRIGGHCETTNRKFDQSAIDLVFKEQRISTGLDKLGTILGEGSRLGGSVMTAPGITIGKNSFIATGVVINEHIPSDTFVKIKTDYDLRSNKFEGELNSDSKLYK